MRSERIDNERGTLEIDDHKFFAGVKDENENLMFVLDSNDYNSDGSIQCPIWKAHTENLDKTPERFTTLQVIESIVATVPEDDTVGRYAAMMATVAMVDGMLHWSQKAEYSWKNKLLFAGYSSLDLAEAFETMEQLKENASEALGGDQFNV